MPDVALRLLRAQWRELLEDGDALRELAHVGTPQRRLQFVLAHKDQLQHEILVGVDVRQHPDLFERGGG